MRAKKCLQILEIGVKINNERKALKLVKIKRNTKKIRGSITSPNCRLRGRMIIRKFA